MEHVDFPLVKDIEFGSFSYTLYDEAPPQKEIHDTNVDEDLDSFIREFFR